MSDKTRSDRCFAIVLASGSGERFGGDVPKQFYDMKGRPVYQWALASLVSNDLVDHTVLVIPGEARPIIENELVEYLKAQSVSIVSGGQFRAQSVRNALLHLESMTDLRKSDMVLIHDCARGPVDPQIVDRLVQELDSHSLGKVGVIPTMPMNDALWVSQDPPSNDRGRSGSSSLAPADVKTSFVAQTPQLFPLKSLLHAFRRKEAVLDQFRDCANVLFSDGGEIYHVRGDQSLIKLTRPTDLDLVRRYWAFDVVMSQMSEIENLADIRTGTGLDVHKFCEGDHLHLCGVKIPHKEGLDGHSDADVAWHALVDAILGAAGFGDIGDHFPPSDPKWEGASSEIFLRHALRLVREEGGSICNIDVTIICETPRISVYKAAMAEKTARVLNLDATRINIKATTTEALGFLGRKEGIAAQATATLKFG